MVLQKLKDLCCGNLSGKEKILVTISISLDNNCGLFNLMEWVK